MSSEEDIVLGEPDKVPAWSLHEARIDAAFKLHLATPGNGGNCNLFFQLPDNSFRHFTREEFEASEWAVEAWIKELRKRQ